MTTTSTGRGLHNWSIVAADKFVHATRDSGYSSTASAIAELVDNAIQAKATRIRISVEKTGANDAIEVRVQDNGCGMDLFTLRQALRFGGSSRFNDRSGLGRFGMGLPNSSLSQARRVTVTSWTAQRRTDPRRKNVIGNGSALQSYLDVDEIASGSIIDVPRPQKPAKPIVRRPSRSGTIVHWTACDRLDFKRPSTICRHLTRELAQRFRYFLAGDVVIEINGVNIEPLDPMFLMEGSHTPRGKLYGDEIVYTVSTDPNDVSAPTGEVRVRFAELPVSRWARKSNAVKRQMGIVNRAGASILRASREVDYGWFFFGSKRKENYDDWWRCEVHFDGVLDEAFGLTHSKQQIRPKQYLVDILTPDMEASARTLSARARAAHAEIAKRPQQRISETIAAANSQYLAPIPAGEGRVGTGGLRFKILEAPLSSDCFYSFDVKRGTLTLTLDPDHAFYREIYSPLYNETTVDANNLRRLIEILLLSAARAEAGIKSEDAKAVASFRASWSQTIQTLVGG